MDRRTIIKSILFAPLASAFGVKPPNKPPVTTATVYYYYGDDMSGASVTTSSGNSTCMDCRPGGRWNRTNEYGQVVESGPMVKIDGTWHCGKD